MRFLATKHKRKGVDEFVRTDDRSNCRTPVLICYEVGKTACIGRGEGCVVADGSDFVIGIDDERFDSRGNDWKLRRAAFFRISKNGRNTSVVASELKTEDVRVVAGNNQLSHFVSTGAHGN